MIPHTLHAQSSVITSDEVSDLSHEEPHLCMMSEEEFVAYNTWMDELIALKRNVYQSENNHSEMMTNEPLVPVIE